MIFVDDLTYILAGLQTVGTVFELLVLLMLLQVVDL
jgi:hypothetical protein